MNWGLTLIYHKNRRTIINYPPETNNDFEENPFIIIGFMWAITFKKKEREMIT